MAFEPKRIEINDSMVVKTNKDVSDLFISGNVEKPPLPGGAAPNWEPDVLKARQKPMTYDEAREGEKFNSSAKPKPEDYQNYDQAHSGLEEAPEKAEHAKRHSDYLDEIAKKKHEASKGIEKEFNDQQSPHTPDWETDEHKKYMEEQNKKREDWVHETNSGKKKVKKSVSSKDIERQNKKNREASARDGLFRPEYPKDYSGPDLEHLSTEDIGDLNSVRRNKIKKAIDSMIDMIEKQHEYPHPDDMDNTEENRPRSKSGRNLRIDAGMKKPPKAEKDERKKLIEEGEASQGEICVLMLE
jgi:hypothetical protein